MYFAALGPAIRRARKGKSLTQAELARAAGVARTTLNQLENGVFPDIGVRKLIAILEIVGQRLTVAPVSAARGGTRLPADGLHVGEHELSRAAPPR